MLVAALDVEVQEHIDRFQGVVDEVGKRRVVRNGYLPEREILTGVGPVPVKQPRARVHGKSEDEEHLEFKSKLIPPYLKQAKDITELIPWLDLRGISTNDMEEALSAVLGENVTGLSPASVVRCKQVWEEEFKAWEKRSLADKHYAYVWADGVDFNVRLTGERACVLALIGATADGKKELLAAHDGMRESEQSWTELIERLKSQGLEEAPLLAVGDGSLGFWNAISKAWPETRYQRCWTHKAANVLNKLPKSMHENAKRMLHDIWMAESRALASKAMELFARTYEAKCPKAVACLLGDREELLAFYDFPAEHWRHLRTSNPTESHFATVRQRSSRTEGCGSRDATLAMVLQLALCAEKRWRRLSGYEQLGALIDGVPFIDGINSKDTKGADAAA